MEKDTPVDKHWTMYSFWIMRDLHIFPEGISFYIIDYRSYLNMDPYEFFQQSFVPNKWHRKVYALRDFCKRLDWCPVGLL